MSLRPADQKITRASRVLTGDRKLLLIDTGALEGPEGAFISAARQARRLGVSVDCIDDNRAYLQRAGLLVRHRRQGRGEAAWGWKVTLPQECLPDSQKPSDDTATQLAGILDDYIRRNMSPAEGVQRTPSTSITDGGGRTPSSVTAEGDQDTPSSVSVEADSHTPSNFTRTRHPSPLPSPENSKKDSLLRPSPEEEVFAVQQGGKEAPQDEDGTGLVAFREMKKKLPRRFSDKRSQPKPDKPRRSGQPIAIQDLLLDGDVNQNGAARASSEASADPASTEHTTSWRNLLTTARRAGSP